MVPDSSPPLRGATRGVGAALLLRGWLSGPSGVVPPLQEETPPNVSLHVAPYDRFGVVKILDPMSLAFASLQLQLARLLNGSIYVVILLFPSFDTLCPFISCNLLVFA